MSWTQLDLTMLLSGSCRKISGATNARRRTEARRYIHRALISRSALLRARCPLGNGLRGHSSQPSGRGGREGEGRAGPRSLNLDQTGLIHSPSLCCCCCQRQSSHLLVPSCYKFAVVNRWESRDLDGGLGGGWSGWTGGGGSVWPRLVSGDREVDIFCLLARGFYVLFVDIFFSSCKRNPFFFFF